MTPMEILIIEDNAADAKLLGYLFSKVDFPHRLHYAVSGTDASDFLDRRGKFASFPLPHLIIMDLNLPRKDGREILRALKLDPEFRCIPVIMLSTSSSERDICDSYSLGASAFLCKPMRVDRFQEAIGALVSFWFRCAELPHRTGHSL